MEHLIFILISFMSGVVCGTTVSTKNDLLAVIRQDLRRNNDDYVESTISETLTSSKPSKPSITSQASILPVGTKSQTTKSVKTINNIETTNLNTTKNITTVKNSAPFRRVFISSEILPLDDKPHKHRPIKIDPSQFLMTIPEIESKIQTWFTRNYKTNDVSRKNGLDQPDKKPFDQRMWEKTKDSKSDELKRIEALMNEHEKKDKVVSETIPKSRTSQASIQELMTRTKTQAQRMGLVMSKAETRMAKPLLEKAPLTFDKPSTEELQEPWELPRLETTRGVFNRMRLKSRDSSEMPIWRAIVSNDTNKTINKLQVVTQPNKNKAQANKPKAVAKSGVRTETKLRQSNKFDFNRINQLKMKLREGLKLSSLPPGDLLDLWPARGPMVHAMRLKGRLCQRSVLLNEGPKYDSKGNTYMQKFKPLYYGTKKVVDFHQTKAPILVLPRCCNCCRKSVLGCE